MRISDWSSDVCSSDLTLAMLTRTVNSWGNIASIGLAQSHELQTTVMPFILRGVSILGVHSVHCPRAWREDIWHKLSGEWRPRVLDKIVTREVTLTALQWAGEDLIAGKVTGGTRSGGGRGGKGGGK